MNKYKIFHRIRTVAENAVFHGSDYLKPWFEVEDIRFEQWSFNHGEGWLGDAWIATYELGANSMAEAVDDMRRKLSRIIPRISIIAQSYIAYANESFMVTRRDKDYFYINYIRDDDPVGLMYDEKNVNALERLLQDNAISEEFYYLWNDATNVTGTTSKILLMCSAIANLTKKANGRNDFAKIEHILGAELKNKLFTPSMGLRHRLSHGEYINDGDWSEDFVTDIHKRVVEYFNNEIFGEKLITEDVVQPQRNFTNNKSVGRFFLKYNDDIGRDFQSVLAEFNDKQGDLSAVNFEFVTDDSEEKSF